MTEPVDFDLTVTDIEDAIKFGARFIGVAYYSHMAENSDSLIEDVIFNPKPLTEEQKKHLENVQLSPETIQVLLNLSVDAVLRAYIETEAVANDSEEE